MHSQDGTQDEVVSVCKSTKINYTVVNGGDVKGHPVSGLPHVILFNAKGELIFEGRVGEEEKALEDAVKAAPDWLLGDHPYAKLKAQAAQVAARKGLGKVLVECRKLAEGTDEASKQEAGWLIEHLEPYGKALLEKAKGAETADPERSLALYQQAAAQFDGDAMGTEASDAIKRLKDDPAFKKEMDATKILKAVKASMEKLKPCKSNGPLDPKCADCKKKNAAALGGILGQLKGIVAKYDGTHAAGEAASILSAWGG